MTLDGTTVAMAALSLATIVQIGGIAFFLGSLKPELRSLRDALKEHKDLPSYRAHGNEESQ